MKGTNTWIIPSFTDARERLAPASRNSHLGSVVVGIEMIDGLLLRKTFLGSEDHNSLARAPLGLSTCPCFEVSMTMKSQSVGNQSLHSLLQGATWSSMATQKRRNLRDKYGNFLQPTYVHVTPYLIVFSSIHVKTQVFLSHLILHALIVLNDSLLHTGPFPQGDGLSVHALNGL